MSFWTKELSFRKRSPDTKSFLKKDFVEVLGLTHYEVIFLTFIDFVNVIDRNMG